MSDGKRVFIAGKSGTGKSYFARQFVADHQRIIIFDPKDEPAWKQGAEVLRHFAEFPKFLRDMGDGAFRVYYSPEELKEQARLDTLSRILMDWNKGHNAGTINRPVTLVVEEMSDPFPLALRAGLTGFARVIKKGRSHGINVVGVAQRPAEVHPTFRGNLDAAVSFRFSFINDRKAMAMVMQDEQIATELEGLANRHYILWDGDSWSKHDPI